ncbi:hypothetical protein GCM10027342_19340 [Photobacterium alginatilyticum]
MVSACAWEANMPAPSSALALNRLTLVSLLIPEVFIELVVANVELNIVIVVLCFVIGIDWRLFINLVND